MHNVKKLWLVISGRRKQQISFLLILMFLSSLFEVLSVGSVLPFVAALTNPEPIFQHSLMQPLNNLFGLTSSDQIAFPLSVIFICATLIAAIIRITLLYVSSHLAQAIAADLSIEIYRRTLYQDYSIHIARNSSEVINGIITKTSIVCEGVISPILILAGSTFLMVGLLTIFVFIDFSVALTLLLLIGSIYLLIIFITKRQLEKNSKTIAVKSTQMLKSLNEGLGGIREVLLNQSQKFYCKIYREADIPVRKAYANSEFIGGSPKFVIEAIGMTLVAIFAYIMTSQSTHPVGAIPILAAFALGAQRLLPSLQQAYNSFTIIKSSSSSFIDVINLLEQVLPSNIDSIDSEAISFKKQIVFDNVSFRYSKNSPYILNNINLVIEKGDRVGIIGPTGSGKSTLLDLLMGLLIPSTGNISIDDKIIDEQNKRSWQASISHVPQSIFLFDSPIDENIAFGIPKNEINHDRLKESSVKAQIDNLIESWPEKYKTSIGEKGINLSGGQRQRIGIARALYKDAQVLVFDEATSALDNETEQNVINAIESINKKITVFMIAHRVTTLKNCSKIIELTQDGKIKLKTFDEIIKSTLEAKN